MKKFIVPVLSVCFFISCSTDDATINTIDSTTDSASLTKITKKSLMTAQNPENAYDFMGEIYAQILDNCEEDYFMSSNLDDVIANVDVIADYNTDFNAISSDYNGLDPVRVQWVYENAAFPKKIIADTDLSMTGKAVFVDFISMLENIYSLPYTEFYNRVVSYEDTITSNQGLNGNDKQVLLTAASVARYLYIDGGRTWKKIKCGVNASATSLNLAESITTTVTVSLLTD